MLNLLSSREQGQSSPLLLQRAERARRAASLELSRHFDFEVCHKAGINSLDLDLIDNRYLLSGGADGSIAIHDLHVSSGTPQGTYPKICLIDKTNKDAHKFSVETVQWYPLDTGMFISSGADKSLLVWDTNSLKVVDSYEFSGVVYNHDQSQIASHCLIATAYQSSRVRLIDIKSGSNTHTLRGHSHSVLCVRWSAKDDYILATGSEDNRVYIWDIRRAKSSLMMLDQHNGDHAGEINAAHTAHNGHVNGINFTSDGMHIVTFGTDERVRLWDSHTGKNTMVNYGKVSNDSRKCIKFPVSQSCNPDFLYIPADCDIFVFDLFSGNQIDTLRGHYNQVNCVVHNSVNQELYSGGNDRNMLVWVPDTEQLQAFDMELKSKDTSQAQTNFLHRVGTGDAWSSDEEG